MICPVGSVRCPHCSLRLVSGLWLKFMARNGSLHLKVLSTLFLEVRLVDLYWVLLVQGGAPGLLSLQWCCPTPVANEGSCHGWTSHNEWFLFITHVRGS